MAAYSAGQSAYQNHAIHDMESSEILLERYTSRPWMGRQGISSVALALVWGVVFAIRNRRRAVKRD
jgi:hypothetical protein